MNSDAVEPVLDGLLDVGVDGELQPASLDGFGPFQLAHLASDAVDDDRAVAIGAHQQRVVGLLEPGLADDVAALQRVVGAVHLRVGGFPDVAEHVGGELRGRILARRHLLHDDVRQLEIQPAGGDSRDLREAGVFDHDDRPVRRLTPVTLHDLADGLLVLTCDGREQPNRSIQILRVQPNDRHVERRTVLDEHTSVAGRTARPAARAAAAPAGGCSPPSLRTPSCRMIWKNQKHPMSRPKSAMTATAPQRSAPPRCR